MAEGGFVTPLNVADLTGEKKPLLLFFLFKGLGYWERGLFRGRVWCLGGGGQVLKRLMGGRGLGSKGWCLPKAGIFPHLFFVGKLDFKGFRPPPTQKFLGMNANSQNKEHGG